ncbi:MAG TPA: DUF475 domain-containing protein [Syntrophales bacterium]|nr:DUF475 domain-containing protein [Syntrophobacterales bacterium]HQL89436.1 DUF475 domain-containing protein [Syntrophales bacterium]
MDITSAILIVLGLALFESITSIDNAIINAEILQGMQPWARRWFLTWGIFIAVFVVRGVLPWLIVWLMTPGLGPWEALTASLTGDPAALRAIRESSPVLLIGGGVFFVFLFCHWIFLEPKKIGMPMERIFARQGAWFYAVVSVALTVIVWFALEDSPMLAFGAVVGSSAFFITHGFKRYAEEQEARLLAGEGHLSDIGKILYLEVIDLTFSIDGVVGAFAFTLAVPLILLGNGIGAVVVRQLTVYGVDRIKKYVFLKNGAMYSVFVLGCVMLAHGFGHHVPEWLTPLATFVIVGYFFLKSRWQARKLEEAA